MTILGIMCLFFIPLFQYCHEVAETDPDKAKKLSKIFIWLNFFVAIFFGLEIAIKCYAFGTRRAYVQCSMI